MVILCVAGFVQRSTDSVPFSLPLSHTSLRTLHSLLNTWNEVNKQNYGRTSVIASSCSCWTFLPWLKPEKDTSFGQSRPLWWLSPRGALSKRTINNYSPKWRWLAVDIYRAAKRRVKYPPLATDLVQYNTMQCNAMQYHAMQCNTIQYDTIWYNTIQYNTIQCNAIQWCIHISIFTFYIFRKNKEGNYIEC